MQLVLNTSIRNMMQKAMSDFFKFDLKAPLHNNVWSWGAVSEDGTRQALRVWAHDTKRINGAWWVSIDYLVVPKGKVSNGIPERKEHVKALRAGRPTVGVIVTARKPDIGDETKSVKHYDSDRLMVITNEFMEIDNDLFARIDKYIKVNEFASL
jgi:hypothetical protein